MRVAERSMNRLISGADWERLQWGRNMRVAESGILGRQLAVQLTLQWGRNMRVAERTAARKRRNFPMCFNGAAT